MKLFIRIILIGTLCYFLSLWFPWWIIVVAGAVIGYLIPGGALSTFTSGFLGTGIVWLGHAWNLDSKNGSQFSSVILEIIPLGDSMVLIAVIGLIGGLCGGFATMTGGLLRRPVKSKQTGGYYQ